MRARRKLKTLLSRRTRAGDNESGTADGHPDHTQQEEVDATRSAHNGHDSDPLTGQSESSISKSVPISKAIDTPIDELWSLAYEHLRESDGDLIADYEDKLRGNFAIGLGSMLGSRVDVRDKMKTILERKMDEVNRDTWKLKFRSSEVQVKDLVQPVLGAVNRVNNHISAAVGANLSASIAWAGISLLLPFFLNPSKQAASLAKGLEHVSSLIARSYMWESLYTRRCQSTSSSTGPTKTPSIDSITYKDALEMLYREILRFQITGYCYYTSNTLLRLSQDIIQWNEWESLFSKIQDQEVNFAGVNATWGDSTYAEECLEADKRHEQAIFHWQQIGNDVSGLLKAVQTAQEKEKHSGLLQWMCTVDPSQAFNAARDKHIEGTSDWLLRKSEEYTNWKGTPRSLLWLHGKAGCGKSILSSSVINNIKDRHASDPQIALAYFFFSFSDSSKQKVDIVLASLVKQLYASRPDAALVVEGLEGYRTRGERPDTKTLESTLLAATRGFAATFIIIDALDECPTLDGERHKLMTSLRRIIGAIPNNAHVLCTSRAEADIVAAMHVLRTTQATTAKIDLNEQRRRLDRDINLYIESTLASPAYSSWPSELKEEARGSLIEKAEGMFQYVSSQFEALQKLSSPKAVRDAIQQLPVGLDATYDRILLSLEPNYRPQIASSLQWLASSTRDLTVEEMAEVFILSPNHDVPFDEAERLFKPEDCLKFLSNLVVTVTMYGETYIRLAHFTVKEYLISDRITSGPAASFSFTETGSHRHIARASLAYHLHCHSLPTGGMNDFKLADYTYENWAFHLEMVPRELWSPDLVHLAPRGLAVRSTRERLACRASRNPLVRQADILDGPHFYTAENGFPQLTHLLPHFYTAQKGFPQLTELLLGGGPGTNPYLTQSEINMALREAAKAGRIAVVELLLAKGTDLNAENAIHGGAMQVAAYAGHTDVVELLLDSGADIDAHRGEWGSALEAAVRGYRSKVVRLLLARDAKVGCALIIACERVQHESGYECLRSLLDSGADVNKQCDAHGTALYQVAKQMGSPGQYVREAFHLLLDRGADVNLPGGRYGYPLQALCQRRDADISDVMLLLNRGANVNGPGGMYGSALHALFAIGGGFAHKKTKAELCTIPERADFNTQGVCCGSALHAACLIHEGIDAVQFLLKKGADMGIQGGIFGSFLHATCQLSDVEKIRLFLDEGAGVKALGGKYGSALQAAAADGSDRSGDILERLLCRGADVNAQGGYYGTALQAACRGYNIAAVRILLDHGADVNAKGGYYGTALQAACRGYSIGTVHILLEHGADVNAKGGFYGTALHAACWGCNIGAMRVLLDHGADVDAEDRHYGTALHAACKGSNTIDNVRILLDYGADINVVSGKYGTVLQAACRNDWGNFRIASFLIERGADVHQQGGEFGSAWHAGAGVLDHAMEAVLNLLLDHGVDIDEVRGGQHGTALQAALESDDESRVDRVRFLLDQRANVNIGGGKYAFPLQSACAKEHNSELTRLFLDTCPDIVVNASGGLFGSALQAAVHSRQEGSVRLLLEKGADINARGGRYGSALNAAVFRGFWEIVEVLLNRGAIPDSQQLPKPDEQWLASVRATFADEEWITNDNLERQWNFNEKKAARIRVDASRAAVERYKKFWEKTRTVEDCVHVRSEN